MSFEEMIGAAVRPIVPEFATDVYLGDAESYCVLNATAHPTAFGSNCPRTCRILAQLHWFFPVRTDPRDVRAALQAAIGSLPRCTWPSVEPATDRDGGHLIFEFEAAGEV